MINRANRQEMIQQMLLACMHSLLVLPVLNLLVNINGLPVKSALFTFFILTQIAILVFKPWWLVSFFQVILGLVLLYSVFPPAAEDTPYRVWLQETSQLFLAQWRTLLAANLTETPLLLLLIGLFLLITGLTVLLFHLKLALPSLFASLLYLLILHTFTSHRILPHLILIIGIGFTLHAWTQLDHRMTWRPFYKNTVFAVAATLLLVGLAYSLLNPLESSQAWVETKSNTYQKTLDNRGFFDWINNNATGLGFRRTGMGTNTDELGGRLHQDFSPVFRAYTQQPNYWKVMHRTEYTGLGWASNDIPARTLTPPYTSGDHDSLLPEEYAISQNSVNPSQIEMSWYDELSYIAYPYGWINLEMTDHDSSYVLAVDDHSSYITVESETNTPRSYTVSYNHTFPDRLDEDALRQDDGWRIELTDAYKELNQDDDAIQNMESRELLADWFEEELQLPASLPQRVINLAEDITEGLETEYAIIRAVESYLKEEGGYRYSLLDVESTPEGGDYVDHFLFDTRVGYCDNFSTAMTVMLRALGIPTRWTKGFTPGALIATQYEEEHFLVDNSNAHSWPEVFFPSYGWVPFEPSPSFANPVTNQEPVATIRGESYAFDDDADVLEYDDAEADPLVPGELEGEEPDDEPADVESKDESDSNQETAASDESRDDEAYSPVFPVILLALTAGISVAVFRWRTLTWLPKLLISKNLLSLRQAVTVILKLYYLKHQPSKGQTLVMYMNDWKPFLSNRTQKTLDPFIALANRAYYAPKDSKQPLTLEEQTILLNMLTLFAELPNADARATHRI